MNFKEWLMKEASPGARHTDASGINLAVPTTFATYGSEREIDYYGNQNLALTALMQVARGGIGREASELAQKSGLRMPSALGADSINLGKMEKIETVGIPLQTNMRMADGSESPFMDSGKNPSAMLANLLKRIYSTPPDQELLSAIVTLQDLRSGNFDGFKFAIPQQENQDEMRQAETFSRVLAQVTAYKNMAKDKTNFEKYDFTRMQLKDHKEDGGVLWCSFVFPKK